MAKILFIALAAIISAAAPISFMILDPIFPYLGEYGPIVLTLLFASAFGAVGYWLLIRLFWIKSLGLKDLLGTTVLCMIATLVCFPLAGANVGWWIAFSIALYVGEHRHIHPEPAAQASA